MINRLKQILGLEASPNYAQLVKDGAVIIDVRSKSEFDGGHIKGSVNIPVDMLLASLNRLKDKNKIMITCCASGIRSASAKNILRSNGYPNVYNGGGWQSLKNKING